MNKADLLRVGRDVLKPADSGDIVEWLEENVLAIPDSPMPGPFRSERTPWIAEALRIASDPETKLLVILASIQSGKSLFARLFTCHIIANAPGPTAVFQSTDAEAKDFALRYMRPVWNNCPPVKDRISLDDMDRSTTTDFDRMTLYCRGIWNEANLQRLSLRYTIADECWMSPPGHLAELSARVTAFGWMGKRIFMSQGGRANQEIHQLHETTDQRDWNFRCPKEGCNTLQPWVWEQVRFPDDAKLTGSWDLQKVSTGTTYECASCQTRLPDNNATRIEANARGCFVATTSAANSGHIGLHWNSLATMSWGELAVMMIKAKESAEMYGDEEARRQFKQKRLALAWAEEGGEIVNIAQAANYNCADDWDGESVITPKGKVVDREGAPDGSFPFRTAGIDVQRGYFFGVIRRWSKSGHSRLKAFAKIDTWQDVEAFVKKHAVHPALVMVDSGDAAQDVYRQTAMRGWKCAKGSGNEDFSVTTKDGKTTRRFYSDKQTIMVPGLQTRAVLVVWSNLAGKDLMHGLRSRKVFTYALDAGQDYVDQMNAEVRVKDRRTGKPQWILPQGKKDNHAFDCELLGLLAAVRWGIVGKETTETDLPSA
jgi:phage terminase large subunit GpA-like protein